MPFANHAFFISTIPVIENAVKNVLFRGSALLLNFVIYKFFAFLAFHANDYTSFLLFAEDYIQQALFLLDRKFNSQAFLVLSFGLLTLGAGFYDTLIWAFDEPGYVFKTDRVSAGKLYDQMLPNPAYITFIANPTQNVSDINLQATIGANLYASGLNFTLPGLVKLDKPVVVPPAGPLTPAINDAPKIWLDDSGFAVGLDNTIMRKAACMASNASLSPEGYTVQGWACPVNSTKTSAIFDQAMGTPVIWWDAHHREYLLPNRKDNPWFSLEKTGETAIMKQVFGVTKGLRKHWFVQTMWKATMLGLPLLADEEITDLVRRIWSNDTGNADSVMPDSVKTLLNYTLTAKKAGYGYIFGSFIQLNDAVLSFSAEFLIQELENTLSYQIFRAVITQTVHVSSEVLLRPPTPFGPCNKVYRNVATSGIVRSTNCNTAYITENQSTIPPGGLFLGEIDTAAVVIITDLLGDGQSSTSRASLNQTGIDWFKRNAVAIDGLLLSRAAITSETNRAGVMVDVIRSEAAVSYFQLVLTVFPVLLFVLTYLATFFYSRSLSPSSSHPNTNSTSSTKPYFDTSFLSAVLATTHISTEKCLEEVGYIHHMPELGLRSTEAHVVLKTPYGGTIVNVGGENLRGMVVERLILRNSGANSEGGWEEGYE